MRVKMKQLILLTAVTMLYMMISYLKIEQLLSSSPQIPINTYTNSRFLKSYPRINSTSLFQNKSNLLFVKTHKCGTTTLVNMFYLYGIRRKLNFVMTPYVHQLRSLDSDKLLPPRSAGGKKRRIYYKIC